MCKRLGLGLGLGFRVREAPYQCHDGPQAGQCSRTNYFDQPKLCSGACIHDHLLPLAPYHPLWYPGPLAKEFKWNETQPRYKHSPEKISLRARGIDLSRSDVMMSGICRSNDNQVRLTGPAAPLVLARRRLLQGAMPSDNFSLILILTLPP